jgi:hypothetical protein
MCDHVSQITNMKYLFNYINIYGMHDIGPDPFWFVVWIVFVSSAMSWISINYIIWDIHSSR